MGDVVHFDIMFQEFWEHGHKWVQTICNIKICCTNRHLFNGLTSNISEVTCPECLKKLGVVKEVDEEKVAFAKFIMKYEHDREDPCDECWMVEESDGHAYDCIVKKAEAYLNSVKGE